MKKIIEQLKQGDVGILPTDTLYGVVGSALNEKVVERIYGLKKRNPQSPFIVLISDISDLDSFGIRLSTNNSRLLTNLWPGPFSVILPCENKKFEYLHRGTNSIAFRLPKPLWLRKLLGKTGPLVAPSANPEEKEPASTIPEAKKYFGNNVDFYLDKGRITGEPSTIIKLIR